LTRWSNKERGVFASRSPHRPNHIGFSIVELLGVADVKTFMSSKENSSLSLIGGRKFIVQGYINKHSHLYNFAINDFF